MDFNRGLTEKRLGYGAGQTYSAIGLMIDGERTEFALVKGGFGPRVGGQVAVKSGASDTVQSYEDFDSAVKAYNEEFAPFLIGKKVRLTKDCGSRVIGSIPPGLTGTVSGIDGYIIAVTLDERVDALDEWENDLHFSAEGWTDWDGKEILTIEDFLTSVDFIDGTVSEVSDDE